MARIIKVRCNGAGRHVNEVDVEALVRETSVYRIWGAEPQPQVRERYVLPCRQCTDGDVVVARAMIEGRLHGG